MPTAMDLITQALKEAKILGVGQVAQAADVDDALARLNYMLAQWRRKRWLVFNLLDIPVTSTGAISYTVGLGGDIDVARPDKIQAAYIRLNPGPEVLQPQVVNVAVGPSPFVYQSPYDGVITVVGGTGVSIFFSSGVGPPAWTPATSPISVVAQDTIQIVYSSAPVVTLTPSNPVQVLGVPQSSSVDRPLTEISAYEDYSRIALKGIQSLPQYFFYDPAYPLGKLYVWPIPQAGLYEIHIIVKNDLVQVQNVADELLLPPEYEAAVLYNLAYRLRSMVGLPMDPVLEGMSRESLEVVRGSNIALTTLRVPEVLRRRSGRAYNIFGDTNGNSP